ALSAERWATVRYPKGLRHHSSTPQGAAVVVYRHPTATTMDGGSGVVMGGVVLVDRGGIMEATGWSWWI
nr:hypothetical protein [Tanacetum cinerariifolium]